ncbi:TIGR03086 family metal-binding protein [Actinomycetospora lutea]|uniref:TIGR03086 family metal-binding protein n=1 Tax=Actinomycetospora lutea TaxID=663604 RepID=UPI002365F77F|nr:TIGR03086 family metal-binding protein [Actinomycetospora lutea]MDD7942360.1 TIGR03086 family metal-binding protein [Actinomycetospora lutea]
MSDTADARALVPGAMDRVTARVRAVGAGIWRAPTPCTEWAVRDLVAHLCFEHLWAPHVLAGTSMGVVGDRYDGDLLHGDPPGAWQRAVARSRPVWTATDTHAARVHTSFGWIPVEEYAEQMLLDLTVHEWDLARGAGLDEELDPVGVERALSYIRRDPVMLTGPGLWRPPVAPCSDEPRDVLLALLGREVQMTALEPPPAPVSRADPGPPGAPAPRRAGSGS